MSTTYQVKLLENFASIYGYYSRVVCGVSKLTCRFLFPMSDQVFDSLVSKKRFLEKSQVKKSPFFAVSLHENQSKFQNSAFLFVAIQI